MLYTNAHGDCLTLNSVSSTQTVTVTSAWYQIDTSNYGTKWIGYNM